jgi:serine O-acetyltransferase
MACESNPRAGPDGLASWSWSAISSRNEAGNVRPSFRRLRLIISSLRLWPHLTIMLAMNSHVVKADLTRWADIYQLGTPRSARDFSFLFLTFMTFLPEYRNLFYLRAGIKARLFAWMCPSLATLEIAPTSIGPGLFIQHGNSTMISAESIGANCWINQHVVIGYSNDTDRPTLGDNVRISAGAKVIGNIKIGNNATIGLNTVVIDNVPPNVTVFGVPGRIIWKG